MLILGHRGTITDSVSQNSLQAFRLAVDVADGFESDACVTKDGEIFLIHEENMQGVYSLAKHLDTTSIALLGNRRLDQITADEARKLRLKDGQLLPTLREAIELVGSRSGKLLNVELKAHSVAPMVLQLVKSCLQNGLIKPEALLLSSFNHAALVQVRQQMPELKIGAIFTTADETGMKLYPWLPDDNAVYAGLTPEALENPLLHQIQPDCIVMPEELLTLKSVEMVSGEFPQAQLAAWVYTERGNFDMHNLLGRLKPLPQDKIAALIVDHPRAFVDALR